MIYVRSPGMQKIPFLSAFLDGPVTRTVFSHPLVSAVAVWGHRPTAKAGETYARTHDLPLLRIEDGFLRSLDLGCHGAPPLSLVVDTKGIYYDASTPSDLEDLLEHASLSTALLTEAETAIDQILKHDLSKYNHAPKTPPGLLGDDSRSRVVLLDQTRGDKSIALGGADQA
jgi:capsular polysaccharide export protein